MIRFRGRKYGDILNTSYAFVDSARVGSLDCFMIGDEVHILFDVEPDQAAAINRLELADLRVHNDTVQIPCVVVRRYHSMVWKQVGQLQDLGMGITMEAKDGYWEDVLKWITLGKTPTWGQADEGPTDD